VSLARPLAQRQFTRLWGRPVSHPGTLRHRQWRPLSRRSASIVPRLFSVAARAGEPPYEAVLGLGKVWVNGRLVVDPPPAAYALREGDAHPSGIDPAAVQLAELRVVAMAAAIARGASKAKAVASGQAAVAAAVAEAPGEYGAVSAAAGNGGAGSAAASSSEPPECVPQ